MDLASAGPLEVKFIIALRRSTPVIEYRRFELGPPGESKLPLSNREYTDFLKILNNKNFYKFLDFCSAPQDFGLLGFFCARFPPREATHMYILERGDFPTPHTKRALPRITLKF